MSFTAKSAPREYFFSKSGQILEENQVKYHKIDPKFLWR